MVLEIGCSTERDDDNDDDNDDNDDNDEAAVNASCRVLESQQQVSG